MFDQCPGFWRREPGRWGAGLPHAVGATTAAHLAYDLRYDVEHGSLAVRDLPGKAYDAVILCGSLETDLVRIANQEADARARRSLPVVR